MANNYETATVSPNLPVSAVSEFAKKYLSLFGFSYEPDGDELYFYADEGLMEAEDAYWPGDITVAQAYQAMDEGCPVAKEVVLKIPKDFHPDSNILDYPECVVDWPEVFQLILNTSTLDEIVVEAAMWCDKARPGEFGGWVTRITPNQIQHGGTGQLVRGWRNQDA